MNSIYKIATEIILHKWLFYMAPEEICMTFILLIFIQCWYTDTSIFSLRYEAITIPSDWFMQARTLPDEGTFQSFHCHTCARKSLKFYALHSLANIEICISRIPFFNFMSRVLSTINMLVAYRR